MLKQLAFESRDLSQAKKNITIVKPEQIHKMTMQIHKMTIKLSLKMVKREYIVVIFKDLISFGNSYFLKINHVIQEPTARKNIDHSRKESGNAPSNMHPIRRILLHLTSLHSA